MDSVAKALIAVAALAFVLAVWTVVFGSILEIPAESFSRTCNNLGVLAIAILLCCRREPARS